MNSFAFLLISLISAILIIGGCSSKPVKTQKSSEGYWSARALVRDQDQGVSYIVNLAFNAKGSEGVRMDVSDTLNTPVASLLVKGNSVEYVIYRAKKFFYGDSQANVMRPILSSPFDPRWVENLLYDEAIADKSWTCQQDKSGLVSQCKDAATGVTIQWSSRSGSRKTVEITHAKAEVQISFKEYKAKVENRKNLFKLEAPEGFQKLRVR